MLLFFIVLNLSYKHLFRKLFVDSVLEQHCSNYVDPIMLFKISEDSKELLLIWVIFIEIYCIQN